MPLEVRVLGATEFTWEGEALRLDRPLERAFAVRLALARGTPVSDDALALDLWGDVEQTRPAERLRVLASRLRASLGPAAAALRRVPGGYVLDAVPVDLAELDAAWGVSRAPSVRPSADVAELLTLWRGPALSDLRAVPFARDEGERLDGVRLDLELAHLSGLIDHGAAVPAAAELERLAQQRPLHERAACLLALALYRSGRQADALDRLARLRASLADELGVDPSPETAELEVRILRHSPELAAALQPSDAPALGLPAPATRFVGREGELAALVEQLRAAAVITLAGAPGAGKTRLAAEVARTERSRGRQVVWVDLAPLRDEQALLPAVLAAAGVEHGGDELGRLAAALDGALLVVDNAEHLVERAAALVRSLAGAAAGLSVLVTSQRPLLITGEELHHVTPLPPAAAAALFCARGGIERDARVDAVCAAVDYLPLGIELAAGLLRALTLDQIVRRIDDRLRLLVGGSRDSGVRHTSLRAALDWSYGLLDETAQAVLRRLAVFSGGCTLEAAEQVVPGGRVEAADVAPVLADLVDRSLVSLAPGPRFLLLETVRDHALRRLAEAGEEASARAAHLAWCRAYVAAHDVQGENEVGALDAIYAEWPNLLAALEEARGSDREGDALRLALALDDAWMFRGRHDQARLHYPRLVDADGLSAAERARALSNYAFACALIGDTDTAATVLDRASHEAVQAGEPELEMRVLYHRGIALVESGRPLDAREPLLAAEAIAEQLERERAVAAIRDVRATALLYAGDAGAATQLHVESNRVDRAAGHEHGLVRGLVNEAFSRFADGDLDGALGCIAEGAHFAAQLQDVVAAANLRVLRANIAAARGELDNAVAELTSALDTLGSDEIDAKTCQLDLADVLVRLGRHDEAQAHVTTVLEAVGGVHGVAWLLAQPTLASLAAARGEHDVAADIVAATNKEYAARGFHWSVAEQRLAAARKTL